VGSKADNRTNNYARVKRYRARRRAAGQCQSCPSPAAPGRTRCAFHLERQREIDYARRSLGLPVALVREL